MVSPSRKHERSRRSLDRKNRKRTPRDPVLIVCEGEATEPTYFKALRASLRLGAQVVDVRGSGGASDPLSVVQRALDLIERRAREDRNPSSPLAAYKRVFCVMDVDDHKTLDPALDAIRKAQQSGVPIETVISSPCFEVWYFLHFQYSTRHWAGSSELQRSLDCPAMLPGYDKGKNWFSILGPLTDEAITNALKLETFHKENASAGNPNPSTQVQRVVQHVFAMLEVKEE